MIVYLYKKIKLLILKKKLLKNKKGHISGDFECTSPDKVFLSDYIYVGPNCKFYGYGELEIGSNVIIGNNVCILTSNHNYDLGEFIPYDYKGVNKKVTIEDNVWISSFVFILPGVTISEGAVVGGGSVVTKDVPKYAVVCGNPAKIVKYRNIENYFNLKKNNKLYLLDKYKCN